MSRMLQYIDNHFGDFCESIQHEEDEGRGQSQFCTVCGNDRFDDNDEEESWYRESILFSNKKSSEEGEQRSPSAESDDDDDDESDVDESDDDDDNDGENQEEEEEEEDGGTVDRKKEEPVALQKEKKFVCRTARIFIPPTHSLCLFFKVSQGSSLIRARTDRWQLLAQLDKVFDQVFTNNNNNNSINNK